MSVTLTITYAGTSLTDTYAIPFDYYMQNQVLVTTSSGSYTWTFPDAGHIKLSSILPTGVSVTIARKTNTDTLDKLFQAGSGIPKSQLNAAFKQAIFAIQEIASTVGLSASISYVDSRDTITLNSAKSYTDAQLAAAMIAAGAGNVVGPASATDGAYVLFNGTTGKLLKVGSTPGAVDWSTITGKPSFATVATSGLYSDLSGKPVLATVATSGAYTDLSGKPTLGTAAALNVGVAASNVVQLDGSAKLPAVDGSQLTGIVSANAVQLKSYLTINSNTSFTLPVAWPTDQWFGIEAIGAGGGSNTTSGAAGGTSSGILMFRASELSWPLAVVVGIGGVGAADGTASTVIPNASTSPIAYGGGGSRGTAAGGASGSDRVSTTNSTTSAGSALGTFWDTRAQGLDGGGTNNNGKDGYLAGGSGGGGAVSAVRGGNSVRGGGGGSGNGAGALGGTSVFAGAGGAKGANGVTPGGGAGAGTALNGGNGQVRIYVVTT